MRITYVSMLTNIATPPLGYGGSELLNWNLVRTLAQEHEVILVAVEGSKTPPNGQLIPLSIYSGYSLENERRRIYENKDVIEALKSADVVIDASDYKQASQWVFENRADKNAIIYFVNGVSWVGPKIYRNCLAMSKFHSIQALLGSGLYAGTYIMNPSPIKKCEYLYPAFFPEEYPYNDKFTDSYIVNIARFHPDKGQRSILEIAREMPEQRFVLAGSTKALDHSQYFRQIKPIADNLPNVELIENPTEEQKKKLFREAKAFLNGEFLGTPYLNAFGLTNVEALLSGTPVIATPMGATPEIVIHKKCGYLIKNANEVIDAIRNISLIDRQTCRKMGEYFDAKNIIEKANKLIKRVKEGEHW